MPVVYVAGLAIGLVDEQVYAIGIAASDQSERGTVIATLAVEPTMCEQFEAPVVALDHDQGFPDLAAVLQKKLIM
jgi:hypothetical protein